MTTVTSNTSHKKLSRQDLHYTHILVHLHAHAHTRTHTHMHMPTEHMGQLKSFRNKLGVGVENLLAGVGFKQVGLQSNFRNSG